MVERGTDNSEQKVGARIFMEVGGRSSYDG
jgi:hypothetical protein